MLVEGEKAFNVPANSFAVSASESGYTLAYSADGVNFTEHTASTPANETLVVCGLAKGMIFKLVGNTGTVYIQY